MKKYFAFFVIAILVVSNNPANAMSGGQDATGDERVVGIIDGENAQRGCSGALIAPRIVFTAAHCLTGGPRWVSSPGIIIPIGGTPNKVKAIAQFVSPLFQNSGCDNGDKSKCHGPRYDFGVLILEKPLGTKTFRYATSDEIEELKSSGSSVLSIGYGITSYYESKGELKNQNPNKSDANIRKSYIWQGGDELVKPFPNNMIVQTRMPQDIYLGGGDSGSPIWFEKNGQWIYIGALSGAMGPTPATNPNDPMWDDWFWGTRGTVGPGGQYFAAQAFSEVIQEANNFLADQISIEAKPSVDSSYSKYSELKPVQAKKVTITCVKGKLVKRATSIKPVCKNSYK